MILCLSFALSGFSQGLESAASALSGAGSDSGGIGGAGRNVSAIDPLLSEQGEVLYGDEANSILVIDYPENIKRVEEYLGMVDVPPQQVHIEARIVEVKLEGENALGINWTLFADKNGFTMGGFNVYSANAGQGITQATSYKNTYYPPNQVASGSETPFSLTVANDNISLVMQALANEYDTDILSAPSITTVNNREAEIRVTDVYPWAEPTVSTSEGGSEVSWEVNFEPAGIILKTTPTINEDGKISMLLQPEVSEKTDDYEITLTTANNQEVEYTVPIIESRQAQTKVVVASGETLIIGGMIKNKVIDGESKIPLLGDIPYLGYLFKSAKTRTEKTELVIFVSPTIITRPEFEYSAAVEERIRPRVEGRRSVLKMVPLKEVARTDALEKELKGLTEEEEEAERLAQAEQLYSSARSLYRQRRYEEAYETFNAVHELRPGYAKTDYYLRILPKLIRKERKKREKQEQSAEKKAEQERLRAEKEQLRAEQEQIAEETRQQAEAEKQAKTARKREVRELYKEALTLYGQKDYPRAEEKFKQLQTLSPGYGKTEYYLRKIDKIFQREVKQEEKRLQKITRDKVSDKADALYRQAVSLYKEGEYLKAFDYFSEVERISPGYANSATYLRIIPKLIEEEKEAREVQLQRERTSWTDREMKRKEEIERALDAYN